MASLNCPHCDLCSIYWCVKTKLKYSTLLKTIRPWISQEEARFIHPACHLRFTSSLISYCCQSYKIVCPVGLFLQWSWGIWGRGVGRPEHSHGSASHYMASRKPPYLMMWHHLCYCNVAVSSLFLHSNNIIHCMRGRGSELGCKSIPEP